MKYILLSRLGKLKFWETKNGINLVLIIIIIIIIIIIMKTYFLFSLCYRITPLGL